MHNDTNYHDYDDEPKNEKNETKNSKGFLENTTVESCFGAFSTLKSALIAVSIAPFMRA